MCGLQGRTAILSSAYFRRWRVFQNWSIVIGKIQGEPEAREAARGDRANRLATHLADETKRMEDVIPAGEPIRWVGATSDFSQVSGRAAPNSGVRSTGTDQNGAGGCAGSEDRKE
jgi:hypothetical protein